MSSTPLQAHAPARTAARSASWATLSRVQSPCLKLIILRRKARSRVHLTNGDRLFFVQLYRWFPSVLKPITIIRPEPLVRWHRAGFRRYCRRQPPPLPCPPPNTPTSPSP